MSLPHSLTKNCRHCHASEPLMTPFSMAFQPIVDIEKRAVFAYEALVRGANNESAGSVLDQLNDNNRYWFDQLIRVKAIELAAQLNVRCRLSINFLPNAVYRAETCIRQTLQAAQDNNFPTEKLMFEATENEQISDHDHLKNIFQEYKRQGFTTAIDDFGAGFSGLNLLANWQPDIVKLDMALCQNIDKQPARRSIVKGIVLTCRELGIKIIAEGIESLDECQALSALGINLFQGYWFARPGFEKLPSIPDSAWPE